MSLSLFNCGYDAVMYLPLLPALHRCISALKLPMAMLASCAILSSLPATQLVYCMAALPFFIPRHGKSGNYGGKLGK